MEYVDNSTENTVEPEAARFGTQQFRAVSEEQVEDSHYESVKAQRDTMVRQLQELTEKLDTLRSGLFYIAGSPMPDEMRVQLVALLQGEKLEGKTIN